MNLITLLKKIQYWIREKKHRLSHRSVSRREIEHRYKRIFGESLNTHNPETFTAKIACSMLEMLNEKIPVATMYADKLRARGFVEKRAGQEYLVPLLWHGRKPSQIPFSDLPEKYVIKTNHASDQVILVDHNLHKDDVLKKLNNWLNTNYYWDSREFQYFHIKPQIMIEEYLVTNNNQEILDYRFYCFSGVATIIQVDNNAHSINCFFDPDWNLLNLWYRPDAERPSLREPVTLSKMLQLAATLSADFDFVRVDLYEVNGKIYFGELTFTPVGGYMKFNSHAWDLQLGREWNSFLNS